MIFSMFYKNWTDELITEVEQNERKIGQAMHFF
jgi:hypothetical protein